MATRQRRTAPMRLMRQVDAVKPGPEAPFPVVRRDRLAAARSSQERAEFAWLKPLLLTARTAVESENGGKGALLLHQQSSGPQQAPRFTARLRIAVKEKRTRGISAYHCR